MKRNTPEPIVNAITIPAIADALKPRLLSTILFVGCVVGGKLVAIDIIDGSAVGGGGAVGVRVEDVGTDVN